MVPDSSPPLAPVLPSRAAAEDGGGVRRRNPDAGIALLAVLLLVAIASATALCFLHKAAVGTAATASRAGAMQAQYLAESAANHAMWRLLNEETFPASPDVYYMHSLAGGRYGYKVRRHTATTFATVAAVGAIGDQVAHQSYVLYFKVDSLGQGLAGRWMMDEASGNTAYDSSGNSNDGNLTNMEASDWVPGKSGKGLNFNGSDEYVRVAHDSTLSISSALSAAAWVANDTLSDLDAVIAKGSSGSTEKDNYWFGTSGDEIGFGYSRAGTYYMSGTTNVNLQSGAWVHIAVTFDNATDKVLFYKNGSLVSSGTLTGNLSLCTNTGPVYIGRSRFGHYFDGKVDDVRLYNRVLSPAEVLALYQKAGS